MKKNIIILIGVLLVLVIVGLVVRNSNDVGEKVISETTGNTISSTTGNIVEITSSGFNPSTLTIKQGGTVTFINRGRLPSWPASAVHPTHKSYPGSNINKCRTAEESMTFDACHGLKTGESYTFIFNEKGDWEYHDHFAPNIKGKIIVQ